MPVVWRKFRYMIDACSLIQRDDISRKLTHMMSLTDSDGLERGIFIYKRLGKIGTTDIQTGDKSSIDITMPRFTLATPIATVHTHPKEEFEDIASVQDIKTLTNSDLKFSVVLFDDGGSVMADVFRNNHPQDYSDIQSKQREHKTSIRYVESLNEALHVCTVQLGDK